MIAAFLIGVFLGACLTAGGFIYWGLRDFGRRDDSDDARGVGA